MRIFDSCYKMMSEVGRDLKEVSVWVPSSSVQDVNTRGNAEFDMRELINYSFCLTQWPDNDHLFHLHPTQDWAMAEFEERISPEHLNPGQSWKLREEMWVPMLERNKGRFAYTYNNRIRDCLIPMIRELVLRPTTRQAVISIWNPTIDTEKLGVDRVPCSMYYQFLIRVGQVHLIYNMRSGDFCAHFGNDVFLAIQMLQYVTAHVNATREDIWMGSSGGITGGPSPEELGEDRPEDYDCGYLYMNIGSLHSFRKDSDKLERFLTMK